jgi:RND family efflux transporter MFP subunit
VKKFLIIALIIVIAIAAIFIRSATRQQSSDTGAVAATIKAVEVMKAPRGEIRSELQLSGTIEANSRVTVFPEVAGKIIQMDVDEGERVTKGQTLAVIEHAELRLQVRQAEAALRAAETAFSQAQQLAEIRVKSQIDQAQAQLRSATVSLQQVEDLSQTRTTSQVEQAKAGLESLKANLEKIKRGARDEDLRQAEAALAGAKASLTNAKTNYERNEQLFENGAISKQSFESTMTQLDIAKSQYEIAREQSALIQNGAREEDIQAMEAQVAQAEAALKLAYAQVDTKTWEKDKALAQSQVEAAHATLKAVEALASAKSWEAEIIAAETAVEQAKVALSLAQERFSDATITAPISGILSMRYLDLGGLASPTAPIFEVVDMDTVKATVSVIEADLSKLDPENQEAWIEVDALAQPVTGKISLISPVLDQASRSAKVEIAIDNAALRLKPGMFAKVKVPVEIHKNAILLPRSAVIEDSIRMTQTVFVVADGHSKRRQVELGLAEGSRVEIASGLSEGEQVVIAGQHTLKDGEEVTVMNP